MCIRDNIRHEMKRATSKEKKRLRPLLRIGTAIWVVNTKQTSGNPAKSICNFEKELRNARKQNPIPIVTIVVYNLPNRDCSSGASLGEICCRKHPDGSCDFRGSRNCKAGLARYFKFINRIGKIIRRYCGKVPMSVVVEPDSLPNLVTNSDNPKCRAKGTQDAYRKGIKYAVNELHASCKKASLYIDAAHGRWLGYEPNAEGFVREIKALNVAKKIRGFATNVANHNPLGVNCPSLGYCNGGVKKWHRCCKIDPCNSAASYNPAFTELNYVRLLHHKMAAKIRGFKPHFIIDTGRNGDNKLKSICYTHCNPRGARLGVRPTVHTANPSLIDAYLWIKPPGDSDGCSRILTNGRRCSRYDRKCGSMHSIGSRRGEPKAPGAGTWFPYQHKQLRSGMKS